ncbi:MAG: hypothetical protein ACFFDR_14260, partial [Candidatus Thorarchaeota archaeon]
RKEVTHVLMEGFRSLVRIRKRHTLLSFGLLILFILPFSSTVFCQPATFSSNKTTNFSSAAEPPILTLTYHTKVNTTPAPLVSGARISGDHIFITGTWLPKENVNGTKIVVNAPAIPRSIESVSTNNSVEIDTKALGNNATCIVNATTWLLNGTAISQIFTNIFLGNFFVPNVKVLSPNGGEIWTSTHNITWLASDKNADDLLTFEVHLSSDNGASFQLLGSDISKTWISWDFSEFQNLSSYVIEIQASDGIYQSLDKSDHNFTAGTVNPTSTITSPTATTADTIPPPVSEVTQTALFIAAAIIMSAFLSVIVYYQAKKLS